MFKFCSLYSGSSGNAVFVSSGDTKILVDAGLSGKRILQALCSIGEDPADLSAILISHEHSDHIKGAGILSRKLDVPIYANERTWQAMENDLGKIGLHNIKCFETGKEFEIGDLVLKAFNVPHDAAEAVGFNFHRDNRKITTATDIGHITQELIDNLEGSELVLLESNHDLEMLKVGSYPYYLKRRIMGDNGHLSNEMASKVVCHLANKGTRRFLLGHLSHENNFPELAFQTVKNALDLSNIQVGIDILLEVALRDKVGIPIAL